MISLSEGSGIEDVHVQGPGHRSAGADFDQSGLDEAGATPFWRAAYADDVAAMTLLIARGADPALATMKPKGRPPTGTGDLDPKGRDLSGLPPIPVGGPDVTPLLAASGKDTGGASNSGRARSPTRSRCSRRWAPP